MMCEIDFQSWNRSNQWFLLPTIVVGEALGQYWITLRFLKASLRMRLWKEKRNT